MINETEKENILNVAKKWDFDDKILVLLKSFINSSKFIFQYWNMFGYDYAVKITSLCNKCNANIITDFFLHHIENCNREDVTRFLEQNFYVCGNCIDILIKKMAGENKEEIEEMLIKSIECVSSSIYDFIPEWLIFETCNHKLGEINLVVKDLDEYLQEMVKLGILEKKVCYRVVE